MKSILFAILAAGLLTGTAAYAAPPPRHMPPHAAPVHAAPAHHAPLPIWRTGQRFSKGQHSTAVSNYQHYHLRKPGFGQHWVRVNNQYLLVNILTGLIASAAAAQ